MSGGYDRGQMNEQSRSALSIADFPVPVAPNTAMVILGNSIFGAFHRNKYQILLLQKLGESIIHNLISSIQRSPLSASDASRMSISGSSANNARHPEATMRWSSTIRTRIGIGPEYRVNSVAAPHQIESRAQNSARRLPTTGPCNASDIAVRFN